MVKQFVHWMRAALCATALLLVVTSAAVAHAAPSPSPSTASSPAAGTGPSIAQTTGAQVPGYMPSLRSLPPAAAEFAHTLETSSLLQQFTFKGGQLGLARPLAELIAQYHLDATDVQYIENMLTFAHRAQSEVNAATSARAASPTSASTIGQKGIGPNLALYGWRLYFSNWDVMMFLVAAAEIGPAAIAAALSFVGSIFGGPVGTVVSWILSVIGWPALATFCYIVMQAAWTGRGVYIGIHWNWWWPNIEFGFF